MHNTDRRQNETSTAKVVYVTYDDETETLTVQDEPLILDTGETVLWQFDGLPDDLIPVILFNERQGLGPFAALRQDVDRMWGEGNVGTAGIESTYAYRAGVYRQANRENSTPMIVSQEVSLVNRGTMATTPTIDVMVDVTEEAKGTFEVSPGRCACFDGDALRFRFTGIPEGYVPTVIFSGYRSAIEDVWERSRHFGPFTSFCHEENEILANGSSGHIGTFTYRVALLAMIDGKPRSRDLYRSQDPVIDREEDPIGGINQTKRPAMP